MSPRIRKVIPAAVFALAAAFGALQYALTEPGVPVTTEEVASPHEAQISARIVQRALRVVRDEARPDHLAKRDAHAEPHGCVTARLAVRDDVPNDLRQGVFAEPGRAYDAWVRFSNGTARDDREPDARGMAIKLMGVPGEKLLPDERDEQTQDFLMINHPAFFVKDVGEYERFFAAQAEAGAIPLDALLRGPRQFLVQLGYFLPWNPARWRVRELAIAIAATKQKVATPLAATYFSMLPFKLGPLNVKYSAKPCAGSRYTEVPMPDAPDAHYLRRALVDGLREPAQDLWKRAEPAAACFELRVQRQNASRNMPIEDATIEWHESDSPFITVATLEIPFQTFNSDAQNRFCEDLSFTPWHARPAHRPIGGLNRARRGAYTAVSRARHAANQTPRHEPRGFCLRLDGEPCEATLAQAGRAGGVQ
jgi:hypothetical protein